PVKVLQMSKLCTDIIYNYQSGAAYTCDNNIFNTYIEICLTKPNDTDTNSEAFDLNSINNLSSNNLNINESSENESLKNRKILDIESEEIVEFLDKKLDSKDIDNKEDFDSYLQN
ncbi:19328_t:CDS:1, partial [Dentiscutata erythropus]